MDDHGRQPVAIGHLSDSGDLITKQLNCMKSPSLFEIDSNYRRYSNEFFFLMFDIGFTSQVRQEYAI